KNQPPCWVTQRKIKGNSTQNPAITSIPGHLNNPLDPQPPQITWKIKFLITVPAYSGQRAELETHPGTTCLCDAEDILLPLYYRDNSNFQSCKLWKMLVEHSALWRRVPDTLQESWIFKESDLPPLLFQHNLVLGAVPAVNSRQVVNVPRLKALWFLVLEDIPLVSDWGS
uniref:Uncharacterized protein n=1 Tax=Sus scrofa TaxID=9823 RepID=A0A4X1VXG3_PIG